MTVASKVHSVTTSAIQVGDSSNETFGYSGTIGVQTVSAPLFQLGTSVLTVGAGEEFGTIAAAVNAAHDGDVILVDAGTYTNDFATIRASITMIGVGGMVNMVATRSPDNLKGILTVDDSATIQNFSFSGAAIDDGDGGNGAGIRYEGGAMVLRNDSFTNNQDGILAFPTMGLPVNTIVLDHDTFDKNGSGTGYTHNAYIGAVTQLTVTNSIFEEANVGHELKSRALASTIENNLFYDGPTATPSYDIDLPNGGADIVKNNTIEKGANAENDAMVHYSGEGIPYSGSSLLIQGNAFINDKDGSTIGVLNQSAISVTITGNTFANMSAGQIAQGPANETSNGDGADNLFPDGSLVGVLPGSTQIYTDSAAHNLVLQGGSIQAVEGGAGLLTVTAIAGHIVAIGGSGGMNYTETGYSGGNSITTAAGSTNTIVLAGQDTVDSEGNDTITAGAGNLTAQVNGVATIYDSTGSNQWSVGGTATVFANSSNETMGVGPSGNVTVTGTETYLQITNNGGNASVNVLTDGVRQSASIKGGSVLLRIYDDSMHVSTGGGAVGSTMTFAAGDVSLTSVGADVVYAGSGNANIVVSGAAQVYAGSGQLSVFGHGDSGGAGVYGNGGTVTIGGDTGNITYYGGAKTNTLQSQLSNDVIVGGTGRMTVNGGSREVIRGGIGGMTFNSNGGGADTVSTVAGSKNVLNLSGSDTLTSYGADTIATTGSLAGAVYGASTVNAGNNQVSLTLAGRDSFVGQGHTVLSVTKGAAATVTVGGWTNVSEYLATVTYNDTADAATATVAGGSATVHSEWGAGLSVTTNQGLSSTVTLGTGNATVYSNANDTVRAGSGSDTIVATASNAHVYGGAGSATVLDHDWNAGDHITVTGGSGSMNLDNGCGVMTFIGGSGSTVINGEGGALYVTGGSGTLQVSGGTQGLTFVGGTGASTLNMTQAGGAVTFGSGAMTVNEMGWGAATAYTVAGGHAPASDVINGFKGGWDSIHLSGGVTLASASVAKGSEHLVFSDHSQLVLTGVGSTAGVFV